VEITFAESFATKVLVGAVAKPYLKMSAAVVEKPFSNPLCLVGPFHPNADSSANGRKAADIHGYHIIVMEMKTLVQNAHSSL
jgi:hypothetical protein